MHYLVKLFPEITIKSPPVRKRFTRQLEENLRSLLKPIDKAIKVKRDWEKIDIVGPDDDNVAAQVAEVLANTPGIATFARVQAYPFVSMHDIYQKVAELWGAQVEGKTFCVRAKRQGDHEFTSTELERYVGGGIHQHFQTAGVKLKNPDVTIRLEVKKQQVFVVKDHATGMGGYPIGTQEPVLSLISGGFDSTVASYLAMKRGLKTHYCFFNLGGRANDLGFKDVGHFLWQKYSASHSVKFISVPFEGVVAEILASVSNAYMGVILKRMMLRAAAAIAEQMDIAALVTGESVAQVSSQTLTNLSVIDRVTDKLVLRPLITANKGDIIDISRQIGAEHYAANMPEYCGVISKRPTTRAKPGVVEHEESKFDFSVLDQAIERAVSQRITTVFDQPMDTPVDEFAYVPTDATVIDIRHPDQQEQTPLANLSADVLLIPFYQLEKSISELAPGAQYLLYCDQGVMSRLHASQLTADGKGNFAVYRPVTR